MVATPEPGRLRAATDEPTEPDLTHIDQRIVMHGMRWQDYEVMLAVRGDHARPKMFYLDGELELMSPTQGHEGKKTLAGRLLETYGDEMDLELNGFGSWTLKEAPKDAGAEPDECYIIGTAHRAVPDLVIEIEWTRGGLNKLEIYARLGVREFWRWKRRAREPEIYVLRGEAYERADRSEVLPDLDLSILSRFIHHESQSQAVREYRAVLRERRRVG